MFDHFKQLELQLEGILFENEFIKNSEVRGKFGAELLYETKEGLYFEILSDYRDRVVMLFIGHRYNVEGVSKEFLISGHYQDVVKACCGISEERFWVGRFSSWEMFAEKVITYLKTTLSAVLKTVTPAILEELANEQIKRRPANLHFYRTD